MNAAKWRICWAPEHGRWVVYAPGQTYEPSFYGQSWRHCVNALPYLFRIRRNWRKLSRGR